MTWERPLIYKELTEVYIVNHKRFWTKAEAELYLAELEKKQVYKKGAKNGKSN